MFKRDATYVGRVTRAKWGIRETNSLKKEVEKIMQVSGQKLTLEEWKEVAESHNKQYFGTQILAGEKLIGGREAKSTQNIETRTVAAIRTLFDRVEELKAFVQDLIQEAPNDDGASNGDVETCEDQNKDIEEDMEEDMDEDMQDAENEQG